MSAGAAPAESPAGRSAAGPAVVLVGPPGAGKSTVGAELATLLGVELRDTDEDVERTTGSTVADLFLTHGEEHFRALEAEAVAAAITTHRGVVALGGGAVLRPATQELLAGQPVIFLDVPLADAVRRVGLDAPRPLLAVQPRQQWRALMETRRPLYTAVARVVIDTADRTPRDVAEAALDALELSTP